MSDEPQEFSVEKARSMSAGQFFYGVQKAHFEHRLAEAQRTYDNAKPGDCIQVDPDLLPYINRTEK